MKISNGIFHKIPNDLEKAIISSRVKEEWESLTELARNEFICWVEDAKLMETRDKRIRRTCEDLMNGKRRPCCWIGCIHRTDKKLSPSVKGILDKRKKRRR